MTVTFPIDAVRMRFPALQMEDGGVPRIYLDNPAGTQVPLKVAEAVQHAMLQRNANLGGAFITSALAGEVVRDAHQAMADFFGTDDADSIIIGPSMTALTLHLSRSISRQFSAGDEIITTAMDHEGNVTPWLHLAHEQGLTIKHLPFNTESWRVEADDLSKLLSPKTKLVALSAAGNLTGSVQDITALTALIRSHGALCYLDAVQYAPHRLLDVASLGADFVACSAYKFFGPHLGIVWGRPELLAQMASYRCRTAGDYGRHRYETGTPQIELQAGLIATIDHLAWLGEASGAPHTAQRRDKLACAYHAQEIYELELMRKLIAGLTQIKGITIHGITNPNRFDARVPTVSITHQHHAPQHMANALAKQGIFVWNGNNYGLGAVRQLGLPDVEGVMRIGPVGYNRLEEIDILLEQLDSVCRQ